MTLLVTGTKCVCYRIDRVCAVTYLIFNLSARKDPGEPVVIKKQPYNISVFRN